MNKPLLIFDMDGVLVDVSESYRETIACTVEHFTGEKISRTAIQHLKNEGGWNDDWRLTHHIVSSAGVDIPFEMVRDKFQRLFLGHNGTEGLILREKWVARPGTLEKLAGQFRFAIFTGRPREEAKITLARFAPDLVFDPLIAMEDVTNHKPAPDGLFCVLPAPTSGGEDVSTQVSGRQAGVPAPLSSPGCFYIGDTVDDARCAKAAKVPFIGIAAPSDPLYLDLVFLFQAEGAYAIVDDINYLEEVFAS